MLVKSKHAEFENFKTEKQWQKAGYKLTKNAKGIELWTNRFCEHTAYFYSPDEVEKMTDIDKIACKAAQKENKLKKIIAELKTELKATEQSYDKTWSAHQRLLEHEQCRMFASGATAWQWLYYVKRKVKKSAVPFKKHSDNPYYYYAAADTEFIGEEEYEQLKALYIEKFGGWEHIDLENSKYNGEKWY